MSHGAEARGGTHPQARLEKPVVIPAPSMAYPAVAAGMGHIPLGSCLVPSILVCRIMATMTP